MEVLALAPGLDHTGPHQLLDVVRDRRLRDGKLVPQMLAGATLLVGDGLEDGHPSRVGQGFGDQLELSGRQAGPRGTLGVHELDSYRTAETCQAAGIG